MIQNTNIMIVTCLIWPSLLCKSKLVGGVLFGLHLILFDTIQSSLYFFCLVSYGIMFRYIKVGLINCFQNLHYGLLEGFILQHGHA